MNGYDVYCLYQSIKLHFTTDNYNFFQYDGRTRVSVDSFEKRKDKFLFHRLARKYDSANMVSFLVANFVDNDTNWAKSLLEQDAENNYREWQRVTNSMSRIYVEELHKICPDSAQFNSLFQITNGQYPKLLQHYLHGDIHIEILVILNNIFNFIRIWDKKIDDDIIYPKISRKIRKYGAFLSVDVDKYKKLTKEALNES